MKIAECGFVYMITSPNNRIYVGSTTDIEERVRHYKSYFCKQQVRLYNSLMKYGWENHIFEIVWAGLLEDMYKYETMIGWGYNALEKEGLNCKLPKLGDRWYSVSDKFRLSRRNSQLGRKLSQETIDKLRKINTNRKMPDGHCEKLRLINIGNKYSLGRKQPIEEKEKRAKTIMKPVLQYDLKMNFIREWESARQIEFELGIPNNCISCCCTGKSKTSKGFIWRFKIKK